MGINFKFLKAGNGDSILISTDKSNILVDGGVSNTYNIEIKKELSQIRKRGKSLDLVVLTHYDNDHIAGILKLLENEYKILQKTNSTILKRLWFNSFDEMLVSFSSTSSNKTSAREQIKFDDYIKKFLPFIDILAQISTDEIQEIYLDNSKEIKFIFLSPNNYKLEELSKKYRRDIKRYKTSAISDDYDKSVEELAIEPFKGDNSLTNGASIAFILEHKNRNFLFLGDAHIDIVTDRLRELGFSKENRLSVEFVKLSHHGSKKNINNDFLDLIETNKFIVLTSGGRHKHPNKETFAKILTHQMREKDENGFFKENIEFIYNYDHVKAILTPVEKRKYKAIFKKGEVEYK